MTLCIGGPLHGRQVPLEHEDTPSFVAPKHPLPSLKDMAVSAEVMPEDTVIETVLYRRRPIDIFVNGTSVPAYVYAVDSLDGRQIAVRIAAVLGNTGRHG